MDAITELEEWMESHCYSFQNISIGDHYAPEGLIVEAKQAVFLFLAVIMKVQNI